MTPTAQPPTAKPTEPPAAERPRRRAAVDNGTVAILVDAFRHGDKRAFAGLVAYFKPQLRATCDDNARNSTEADELYSVALHALRSAALATTLDLSQSPQAYIAVSFRRAVRRAAQRMRRHERDTALADVAHIRMPSESLEEAVLTRERLVMVSRTLPYIHKRLAFIVRCRLAGSSRREIAELLGVTPTRVGQLERRAIAALRAAISPCDTRSL